MNKDAKKSCDFNLDEKQLDSALKNNEFYLEYQPKILLETEEIVSLETLVRWINPIHGIIFPGEFIPLAEKTGLIVKLTEQIIEMLCKQILFWKNELTPLYRTSINLSSYDFFNKNLFEFFISKIEKFNLDPCLFEIEITETALFQNIENNISVLKRFKNCGVQISIDDFGTGYSSLSYLQFLEIDNIKIDKSFIKNIPKDTNACILVETIIKMAHSLKINTIAEGVETKQQFDFLKQCNCDEIQGYYITPPLMPGKLMSFIKKYKNLK